MNFDFLKFYFVGNNLALDFINSIMFDFSVEEMVGWAVGRGLMPKVEALSYFRKWNKHDHRQVLEFRTILRRMIENVASGGEVSRLEVGKINQILGLSGGFAELIKSPDGFEKRVRVGLDTPDKLLIPIAESFADLLCFGNLVLLRRCENPDCILYFYDTTKNHRRRWCSMAVCGNRAKANKFYQRKKSRPCAGAN